MNRIINLFLLITTSLFMTACGCENSSTANEDDGGLNITVEGDDGEKSTVNIDLDDIKDIDLTDAEASIEDAMQAIKNAVNDGEEVESMNFRDIKAIIPSRLLGMDRVSHSGEKNGVMGMSVSQANARFEEDGKSLEIDVVDSAGMGLAKLGGMAWSAIDIDKESDNGYERTSKIEGYKAFEKWNSKTGRSELTWMYKDRYIITFKGIGIDGDDLEKARRGIDYEDLD